MSFKPKPIPAEEMREFLEYRDGMLFWSKKSSAKVYIGDRAGQVAANGYRTLWFKGAKYLEHRVIWAMIHGDTPLFIDHKFGDKLDNRVENLRAVTISVNTRNTRNPTLGVTRSGSKWMVVRQIKSGGKMFYFGTYEDLELAQLVSQSISDKYFDDVYHR